MTPECAGLDSYQAPFGRLLCNCLPDSAYCRTSKTVGDVESGVSRQLLRGYRIEKDLRDLSADPRRAARKDRSKPIIEAFELWLAQNRARVSTKSPTGEALKYIAKYWDGLCLFLDDGRIELDNNPVERTIRPIALNRKNALFAGHDAGAQNWAVIASPIETCKLNGIEPHRYLSCVLTAIVGGHKQTDINKLLPWNYAKPV